MKMMSDEMLKEILKEVKGLKEDMKDMKVDMKDMKEDMNGLKVEMRDVKVDMNGMKNAMKEMKEDMNDRFNSVDLALEQIINQNHEDVVGMIKTMDIKLDAKDNEVLAINRRLHRVEGVVEGLSKQ